MNSALPPIVRLAASITRDIEKAVMRFSRYHRHAVGADLRKHARSVWFAAMKGAQWERDKQAQWVRTLVDEVDNLKLSLQLGKELQVFASFAQFEHLARAVADLGRQVGGWNKQLNPKGQSDAARAPQQRAKTLSTRNTSMCEVNS